MLKKTILNTIKQNKGFSLAELLMVLMIILLTSSVVAAGIPVALRAYHKVVNTANAQVALSTVVTNIRTELGTSRDVTIEEKSINYINDRGNRSKIFLSADEGVLMIYLSEKSAFFDEDMETSMEIKRPLVSRETLNQNLAIEYQTVECEDGICIIHQLQAKLDGKVLAELQECQIRTSADANVKEEN